MATQSFQAVRRLQDAGAPLPLVLANPAWQALMDKIDANIAERSSSLEDAVGKIPANKRPQMPEIDVDVSESMSKRQRVDPLGTDLASRKQALLAKINNVEGAPAAEDDYEAYRRQCWIQYYDWMEKQKKGPAPKEESAKAPVSDEESEDDDIHNALLGLS